MSTQNVKAAIIDENGGSEKFKIVTQEVGSPGSGEILIKHKAIGLNFIDVYHRTRISDNYAVALPAVLGMEASGIVEEVGDGVTHLVSGDRVAYAATPPGAYCEARVMPAKQVCKLPDEISLEEGAAMMLKGLTVKYLFHDTTELKSGDQILFHAAAGGVGLIACQWARSEGLELLGTAGSDEKCKLAKKFGASQTINYSTQNFPEEVMKLTNGIGVPVVMDSVGKTTFDDSLSCLKDFGIFISFGNASGNIDPIDIGILAKKSLKITRTGLFTHIGDFTRCQEMAKVLFGKVVSGDVKIQIDQTFSLNDIALAHDSLEARKTTGSTVIRI
jgi:NADPH2:quinone reductase